MPSRSGSADALGDTMVDAGHDVAEVDPAAVADHGLRERVPATLTAAGVGQQARVSGRRQQHRVRFGVGEVGAPVPRRTAVDADDRRQRALGAARCHQQALNLDVALAHPPDRAHVGEHASLDDVVVKGGHARPRRALAIEAREFGRPSVCLVRGPDVGSALADHARRRRHLVADERGPAPTLLAPTVEPDPAAGVARCPRCSRTRASRRRTTRQDRPSRDRATGRSTVAAAEVEQHRLPDEQSVIARIPLDDDGPRRVGRDGEPFHLPGRVVQRARGSARPRSSRATSASYQPEPEWSADHDCHDEVVTVPIELPDAAIVRAHLGGLARCEVDEEQPASTSPGVARSGRGRLGAVDGPGAPVEAVGARIGGQDEQSLAVGGPGEAFGRTRSVVASIGSPPSPGIVYGSWCPGVIRSDRNDSRAPSGDQIGN